MNNHDKKFFANFSQYVLNDVTLNCSSALTTQVSTSCKFCVSCYLQSVICFCLQRLVNSHDLTSSLAETRQASTSEPVAEITQMSPSDIVLYGYQKGNNEHPQSSQE